MSLLESLAKMLHLRSGPPATPDPRLAELQRRSDDATRRALRVVPRSITDELQYADRVLLGLPERRKNPR